MESALDPASARYAAAPAPQALRRVQSLLNTRAVRGEPDLLASSRAANGWLRSISGGLAPRIRASDLAPLRDLRAALQRAIQSRWEDTSSLEEMLHSLRWSMAVADRRLVLAPATGDGWHAVAEPLLAELFIAQERAISGRLKACGNPPCSIAFYDSSKNQSRVWHNTRTCGNLINVRAARVRRRH
jgi:predicted RNA-binding Zn ribbon-like protein